MYSNLKLRANKICRTCMCETTDMRPLFNETHAEHQTIVDMINFITNLDVRINDKLPKQVCGECEVIVSKSAAFKQRCIETDAILKGILNDCPQDTNASEIENSHIKHEKSADTECSSVGQAFQCSVCLENYSNLTELESHVHNFHNVSKETIFNITLKASSDTNINAPVASNEIIKEEALEQFQNQNDYSNDSNDNDGFEAEIEYKQEDEITIEENNFSCSCGLIFDTEDIYKMHVKTDCKIYKDSIDKDTKLIIDIQKQKFVCVKCNMQISTLKAYKTHQRKHKNESSEDKKTERFQCSMCMRKFTKKMSLTAHIKKHEATANVKYTCNTCKREFKHKAHLDNHISVHTRDKKFSCEYCMKNYTTQNNLDEHKKSHKIDKKHQCKFCNKVFCMLSTLTDHIRTHTGEKPFLCSTCGRGFSQKTNLVQHMRRHQGLKPFKCENCDQRFVSKGELVAHNRKHSGAHPFVCDDCGNGFTTSSSLVKHRRIHTGERPYACDLCSMRFAASGTLKNHRRTHTGEKPFQCSYCEKAFVQKHDLVSHIRCHTGERPYVCSTCGQSFRKASALKTHVKVHIKEPLQLQRDMNLSVLQGVNVLLGGMQCDVGNN